MTKGDALLKRPEITDALRGIQGHMACPHPYLCGCGMAVQVAFGTPVGYCNGGGAAPPDLPRKFAASVRKIPVP